MPQDYCYSSLGFVWAIRSDSSVLVHLVRGFSILLFVKTCSKHQEVPKAFQKSEVRWLYKLSEGAYRAVLSSLGLIGVTRSDHPLAYQKPLGTL